LSPALGQKIVSASSMKMIGGSFSTAPIDWHAAAVEMLAVAITV